MAKLPRRKFEYIDDMRHRSASHAKSRRTQELMRRERAFSGVNKIDIGDFISREPQARMRGSRRIS